LASGGCYRTDLLAISFPSEWVPCWARIESEVSRLTVRQANLNPRNQISPIRQIKNATAVRLGSTMLDQSLELDG
ncbi:MAG: hypothetical protein ACO20O_02235, partial [Pseudomonadales bacterium]